MKKVGLVFSLIALMFFMALSIPTRFVFAQSDDIVVFNYDSLARYIYYNNRSISFNSW